MMLFHVLNCNSFYLNLMALEKKCFIFLPFILCVYECYISCIYFAIRWLIVYTNGLVHAYIIYIEKIHENKMMKSSFLFVTLSQSSIDFKP
jgi:hypothetical protein